MDSQKRCLWWQRHTRGWNIFSFFNCAKRLSCLLPGYNNMATAHKAAELFVVLCRTFSRAEYIGKLDWAGSHTPTKRAVCCTLYMLLHQRASTEESASTSESKSKEHIIFCINIQLITGNDIHTFIYIFLFDKPCLSSSLTIVGICWPGWRALAYIYINT